MRLSHRGTDTKNTRALRALSEVNCTDVFGKDIVTCFVDRPHEDKQQEETKPIAIEYAHFDTTKKTSECADGTLNFHISFAADAFEHTEESERGFVADREKEKYKNDMNDGTNVTRSEKFGEYGR